MRTSAKSVIGILSAALLVGGLSVPATATHNNDAQSGHARALANLPRSSDFRWNDPELGRSFQSDLAFLGRIAVAGNYNGFRIIDVSAPSRPRVVRDVWCSGPQNDVSIWGDVIIASVDDVLSGPACGSTRSGPRCGPENAAQFGYDPNHRQISVVEVPLRRPSASRVVAEPKVNMPLFTDLVPDGFNPLGG